MVTTQTPDWPAEAAPAVRNEPGPPCPGPDSEVRHKPTRPGIESSQRPDNSKKRLSHAPAEIPAPPRDRFTRGQACSARACPITRLRNASPKRDLCNGSSAMSPIVGRGRAFRAFPSAEMRSGSCGRGCPSPRWRLLGNQWAFLIFRKLPVPNLLLV